MTEDEWLKCTEVSAMYEFLYQQQKIAHTNRGRRKMRLFACHCCRRIWTTLSDDRSQRAVEVSEQFADGVVSRTELFKAWEAARLAASEADQANRGSNDQFAQRYATEAAASASSCDQIAAHASGAANTASVAARFAFEDTLELQTQESQRHCELLRDMFGNPFRTVTFSPEWRTDTALSLAQQMYESRDFIAMPILADALQDAGCDNADVLDHGRDASATHVRGCWVVDLVLGKG